MFTGLIEEIGKVRHVINSFRSAEITVEAAEILSDMRIGDSICTNGVCLTVKRFDQSSFTADVMPETARRSNLKDLTPESPVNLERALKINDRLGGHILSGHIDGVGRIEKIEKEENATWLTVRPPENLLKYIVEKGSVALDGTSLTVAHAGQEDFKVSIIPITKEKTILLRKSIGDEVNIECDMIGKYIERLLLFHERETESKIDLKFLEENGFLEN